MSTWSEDPGEIAAFAVDLVSVVAGVILIPFAFAAARPFVKASGAGTTAYGWRWALILFTMCISPLLS
jgi:hypothetical protein